MPTIKTIREISTSQRKADGLAIRYAVSDAAGDETVLLLDSWPEKPSLGRQSGPAWPRLGGWSPSICWALANPRADSALLPTGHGDVPPQADR